MRVRAAASGQPAARRPPAGSEDPAEDPLALHHRARPRACAQPRQPQAGAIVPLSLPDSACKEFSLNELTVPRPALVAAFSGGGRAHIQVSEENRIF